MSSVNIKRAVENIRANTTGYMPIVEVIVNAIQAIESNGVTGGEIAIRVQRAGQHEMDGSLPEILSIEVEDNGVGFTQENRQAFDTLYTDLKIKEGGRGFGRFICLKYFEDFRVKSVYQENGTFKQRTFSMGKINDIIVQEKVSDSAQPQSGTVICLSNLKKERQIDKKLETIARNLVEKLLPYFITKGYICPEIILSEADGTDRIRLNDYFTNELAAVIKEIPVDNETFILKSEQGNEKFLVRVFKLYYPKSQKSKISLVAHKREVSGSVLYHYVPEFVDDFYEKSSIENSGQEKNYIVKAYVFSPYLDRHVSLERGGFEFQMNDDLIHGISQVDIEKQAAKIAKDSIGSDVTIRQEKKRKNIQSYVDENAPWHKELLNKIDLTEMPYHATHEEIETRLQREKFMQEIQIKKGVAELLAKSNLENLKENVIEIVNQISGTSKNDLIHHVAFRRHILDIFEKSLQLDETGAYNSEGIVHDIIFPRRNDTETTLFEDHNLWIIDERLNFTSYISSDCQLNGKNSERPDLLVYNKRILFRGDNEPSNPITIFEFKKPQRDDFVNPSSQEDPVQQIVRYVNSIRDGKYKTPEGRKMLVKENTPFYGYVVCDLTRKVEDWLRREKNFTPMPDSLGWFHWQGNINLYVEVIDWDKVLRDAQMRNKVFFQKLGI